MLNDKLLAPGIVLVASKPGVHRVLIEEDMPKAPNYDNFRIDPKVFDVFTATDKGLHKKRVCNP
jgi:hypothetical protein